MSEVYAYALTVLVLVLLAWYSYRLGFDRGVALLTRTIDESLARKRRQDAGLEEGEET